MGKLIDYANLGVDLYQTKQLATISAAQHTLNMGHMLESVRSDAEVEKRKLIMQFESELEKIQFSENPVYAASRVDQIRSATYNLQLTVSGFREFADMERAKSFVGKLEEVETRMLEEASSDDIDKGRLLHEYVRDDDDLEEYVALQHINEESERENNESKKFLLWTIGSFMIGFGLIFGILLALGFSPLAEEDPSGDVALGSVGCGLTIVLLIALWKPLHISFKGIFSGFRMKAIRRAHKILDKGGGQEKLDAHISHFGEMNSDEALAERMRRLEFIVECLPD